MTRTRVHPAKLVSSTAYKVSATVFSIGQKVCMSNHVIDRPSKFCNVNYIYKVLTNRGAISFNLHNAKTSNNQYYLLHIKKQSLKKWLQNNIIQNMQFMSNVANVYCSHFIIDIYCRIFRIIIQLCCSVNA